MKRLEPDLKINQMDKSIFSLCKDEKEKEDFGKKCSEFNKISEHISALESVITRLGDGEDLAEHHVLPNFSREGFEPNSRGWSKYMNWEMDGLIRARERRLPKGSGFCYVLGLLDSPNQCKIGFTSFSASARAKDYGREHGMELYVYDSIFCRNAKAVESYVHELLSAKKVIHSSAQEIFELTPEQAAAVVRDETGSIGQKVNKREARELSIELLRLKAKQNILETRKQLKVKGIQNKFFARVNERHSNIKLTSKNRYFRRYGLTARLNMLGTLAILFLTIALLSYYLLF